MYCFRHRQEAAVGLCRVCAKAVCPECLTDTPHGLACKDSCESRADRLDRILEDNVHYRSIANRQIQVHGIVAILLGVMFWLAAGWAMLTYPGALGVSWFGTVGTMLVVFGVIRLGQKQRFPESS